MKDALLILVALGCALALVYLCAGCGTVHLGKLGGDW